MTDFCTDQRDTCRYITETRAPLIRLCVRTHYTAAITHDIPPPDSTFSTFIQVQFQVNFQRQRDQLFVIWYRIAVVFANLSSEPGKAASVLGGRRANYLQSIIDFCINFSMHLYFGHVSKPVCYLCRLVTDLVRICPRVIYYYHLRRTTSFVNSSNHSWPLFLECLPPQR